MSSSRAINAENKIQYINRKGRIRDKVMKEIQIPNNVCEDCFGLALGLALRIGDLETCTQASNVIWTQAAQANALLTMFFYAPSPMLRYDQAKVRSAQFIFIAFSFYSFCYWSLIFDNFQVSLNFRHSFRSHTPLKECLKVRLAYRYVAKPLKFEDVGVTFSEKWEVRYACSPHENRTTRRLIREDLRGVSDKSLPPIHMVYILLHRFISDHFSVTVACVTDQTKLTEVK